MTHKPLIRDVHLRVQNADAVSQFYQTVIGLTEHGRDDNRVMLGVEDRTLLVLHEDESAPDVKPQHGLYHFALLLPERADLGRFIAHFASTRYPAVGFADHFVSEAFYAQDVENNGIEVAWDLPRDQWQYQDGVVNIGTEALDLDAVIASIPQDDADFKGMPAGTQIGHVHLHGADVPQTADFYRDVLGFQYVVKFGQVMWFLALDGYHHHIGVRRGYRSPENGAGLMWYTLDFDAEKRDQVLNKLKSAGVTVTENDWGWQFADPSGNGITLGR